MAKLEFESTWMEGMSLVKEMVNLHKLYERKLDECSQFCRTSSRSFNCWDVRSKIQGAYSPDQDYLTEDFKGRIVTWKKHPEYGPARIVALKKVGLFYILGVAFKEKHEECHSLTSLSSGITVPDGQGYWVWMDEVNMVENNKG